jgi:hypothetical protein
VVWEVVERLQRLGLQFYEFSPHCKKSFYFISIGDGFERIDIHILQIWLILTRVFAVLLFEYCSVCVFELSDQHAYSTTPPPHTHTHPTHTLHSLLPISSLKPFCLIIQSRLTRSPASNILGIISRHCKSGIACSTLTFLPTLINLESGRNGDISTEDEMAMSTLPKVEIAVPNTRKIMQRRE